jgi:hypothetical protein
MKKDAPGRKGCLYLRIACPFLPGTGEKIAVMSARAERGLRIFVAGDKKLGLREGYIPCSASKVADRENKSTSAAQAVRETMGGLVPIGQPKKLPSRAKPLTKISIERIQVARQTAA